MLIKKIHFSDIVEFTQNIPDTKVNPEIKNAEKYDFITKFGTSLISALTDACNDSSNWTTWAAGTYTTGAKVIHNEKVYFISVSTTTQQPGTGTDWTLKELNTLWLVNVKPYMVYCAYARFLVEHGVNVTQSGMRVAFEDTSNEVDAKTKAMKINSQKSKASAEENLLHVALTNANWTFDGTTYARPAKEIPRGQGKKFGFNAI